MTLAQQLDFAALTRISDLGMRARILVHSYFAGMHPSPHYGRNAEFASYAAYRPGDDIKDIDWRAWARSDEHFVKRYDADCTVTTYLVMDVSGSMCHAGEETLKMRLTLTLTAALSLLMIRQHDACGLLAFADEVCAEVAPHAHERQFERIISALSSVSAGGTTNLQCLAPTLEQRLKRKSLIVLISDLHVPSDHIYELLQRITFYGHEVICFRPLAEEEVTFPYHGNVVLVDAETGERQTAHARDVRQAYLDNVAAHTRVLVETGQRFGVDVETFCARDVSTKPLAAYLVKRKMMV